MSKLSNYPPAPLHIIWVHFAAWDLSKDVLSRKSALSISQSMYKMASQKNRLAQLGEGLKSIRIIDTYDHIRFLRTRLISATDMPSMRCHRLIPISSCLQLRSYTSYLCLHLAMKQSTYNKIPTIALWLQDKAWSFENMYDDHIVVLRCW